MQGTVRQLAEDGSGTLLLDDGLQLSFDAEAFARSGLRLLRPGQRLSLELRDGVVVRLWIEGVSD